MIAAETRRADLRLALAVNEDHDGVEREVLDADLDAGHGSIVAGPAVEGSGSGFLPNHAARNSCRTSQDVCILQG
jgi:hypothetical protein